jgi:ceramide glucosyltransferase
LIHLLLKSLAMLSTGLAAAGVAYYCLCLYGMSAFLRDCRRNGPAPRFALPVSILKPLRGTDPEMYESLRSHCLQDYPEYEIIFGVSDPNDTAVALVQKLIAEFPSRNIRLLVCPEILGTNVKVSNLLQMARSAIYGHLIVNDSDIRVPTDYLRCVLAPFADSNIGMVTCLYRGVGAETLGSRLESIGTSTDFCPAVLAARQLQGVRFGLGSTMAFSRHALDAIGGFEPLLDYLADDYELGARIAQAGFQVRVSEVVVDHFLPDYTMREFLDHQLRWARTIRDSRRWGYAGLVITFPLVWAILAVLLSVGAAWSWVLLAITVSMRAAVAWVGGKTILQDAQLQRDFWLIPLRDVLALLIWLASFSGHKILWRGIKFELKDGKLRPA